MSRPDLPTGFGGWQVLDSTPQEESPQEGGYRLGPCPRRAVKLGQRMNYDVEFVISEVSEACCDNSRVLGIQCSTKLNSKLHTILSQQL